MSPVPPNAAPFCTVTAVTPSVPFTIKVPLSTRSEPE